MIAQPIDPTSGPDVGAYEVIHLGGQAAVVVPVADFRRLRALQAASTNWFSIHVQPNRFHVVHPMFGG
jgi:hypothetical protein